MKHVLTYIPDAIKTPQVYGVGQLPPQLLAGNVPITFPVLGGGGMTTGGGGGGSVIGFKHIYAVLVFSSYKTIMQTVGVAQVVLQLDGDERNEFSELGFTFSELLSLEGSVLLAAPVAVVVLVVFAALDGPVPLVAVAPAVALVAAVPAAAPVAAAVVPVPVATAPAVVLVAALAAALDTAFPDEPPTGWPVVGSTQAKPLAGISHTQTDVPVHEGVQSDND